MKHSFSLLIFFFISCFAYAQHNKPATKQADSTSYTCPIHPEIHSATAGRCPKCGMFLGKKTVKIIQPSMPLKKGDVKRTDFKTDKPSILKPVKPSEEKARDTFIENKVPVKQAPTLTFTESDTAEIYVHNMLDVGTTLHWHGVFLPNKFDGVPYLTQMPIAPHSTHLYRFPVIQNGTYWYHSHSELQELTGMYGAIIFLKKNEQDIPAIPIVLSDWTDMKPTEVDRLIVHCILNNDRPSGLLPPAAGQITRNEGSISPE